MDNPELALALERRTELTQADWEAFGINDLRMDHFIKSGQRYFKPAEHQQYPSPSPSPAALSKPRKNFPNLTFGAAEEATKGLEAFIGLSNNKVFSDLLYQGVKAVQKEFIQHGSLQDLENFYYICYGIAQLESDMPAHVKDDIKKVR